MRRFIPFLPVPYCVDDAREWLENVERAWTESEERTFAIIDEAASEPFQGVVTVRLREGGTVGYWLARTRRDDRITPCHRAVGPRARTRLMT
jgi:hypothetical protein